MPVLGSELELLAWDMQSLSKSRDSADIQQRVQTHLTRDRVKDRFESYNYKLPPDLQEVDLECRCVSTRLRGNAKATGQGDAVHAVRRLSERSQCLQSWELLMWELGCPWRRRREVVCIANLRWLCPPPSCCPAH